MALRPFLKNPHAGLKPAPQEMKMTPLSNLSSPTSPPVIPDISNRESSVFALPSSGEEKGTGSLPSIGVKGRLSQG